MLCERATHADTSLYITIKKRQKIDHRGNGELVWEIGQRMGQRTTVFYCKHFYKFQFYCFVMYVCMSVYYKLEKMY